MAPKKKAGGGKKKKGKAGPVEPPFPVPKDLSEPCPIDAHDGLLGLEHTDVKERVRQAQLDLVLWKISEALTEGELTLELAEHGLDELPEELFDLPWLQVLDLSRNVLVNDVLEDLGMLPSLKAVDLSYNLLHGALPRTIASLPPRIEEISLDKNVITAIPEDAGALTSITWFSCKSNLLTSFPGGALAGWTRLEYLDLRNNKLTEIPPEIAACVTLEVLYVSENAIKELPEALGACRSLVTLHASKNELTAIPSALSTLSSLEELDLSFNKLTDLNDEAIAGMRALKRLLAPSNKIENIPASMSTLVELEVVSLAGNNIKTLPDELGALSKLKEVYFNGNPITAIPPTLSGWASLEEGSFKFCKLKALPPEVATTWKSAQTLDLRAKKKDTCKMPEDVRAQLGKVHVLGAVVTKAKKKKK